MEKRAIIDKSTPNQEKSLSLKEQNQKYLEEFDKKDNDFNKKASKVVEDKK